MSYLTSLAKQDHNARRFYIGLFILACSLQTSQASDIAAVKAEGQLTMQSAESRPSRGLIIN